jgi:hypothetical protein
MNIFATVGLRVWDVENISTHGGSLRVFISHENNSRPQTDSVRLTLAKEDAFGLFNLKTYEGFQNKVKKIADDLIIFLNQMKREGKKVVAYGAAAKGNTLLNYANVNCDLIEYACDLAASKQEKFMPGSHLKIMKPEYMLENMPDCVLILPWNISDEIIGQFVGPAFNALKFVRAVPKLEYLCKK